MDIDDLRDRAEKGSVVAQGALGLAKLFGHEVPVDHAEGARWLSLAAERGAARPAVWLGTMHEQGLGLPVDMKRARRLYEYGAERGEFDGCILWHAYSQPARALRWMSRPLPYGTEGHSRWKWMPSL